jgi:Mg-chelatase subunit ChlD
MRDAVLLGVVKMMKLQKDFLTSDILRGKFNFVHIVLTDGDDNCSKTSESVLSEALQEFSKILPKELLRQIFIGVGVEDSTKRVLKRISDSANGEFLSIQDNEIEDIFQKISL